MRHGFIDQPGAIFRAVLFGMNFDIELYNNELFEEQR